RPRALALHRGLPAARAARGLAVAGRPRADPTGGVGLPAVLDAQGPARTRQAGRETQTLVAQPRGGGEEVNEKKALIIAAAVGVLASGGLGWLIYSEYGSIAQAREMVASTRSSIDESRKLLVSTPQLEKDVIVLRETEETIREILPDEQDVNNFVRTLQRFEEDSGVR